MLAALWPLMLCESSAISLLSSIFRLLSSIIFLLSDPTSAFRLPHSRHGQSLDGQKNDPLVFLANIQKALAANGSPSIGYRIILTGIRDGSRRTASLNKLNRFVPDTLFLQGFLAPMVGRLSVSKKTLSGAGFISPIARKAFRRLVPFCGTSFFILATV